MLGTQRWASKSECVQKSKEENEHFACGKTPKGLQGFSHLSPLGDKFTGTPGKEGLTF